LALLPGHDIIHQLIRYDNSQFFDIQTLFAFLVYYFLFAAWCAGGVSLASGTVVPMICVGALYGRIVGKVMLLVYTADAEWNTPGLFALLGAASFFAGVSRLSISLAIIMIELSGDVLLAFPLMVSIMIGKNVADVLIHSLYHSLLALKGVPYLPEISTLEGMEDLVAADVMTTSLVVLHSVENVGHIERLLGQYKHSGFPVVKNDAYKGLLLRKELNMLLSQKHIFIENPDESPSTILSWKNIKSLYDIKEIMKQKPKINAQEGEVGREFLIHYSDYNRNILIYHHISTQEYILYQWIFI